MMLSKLQAAEDAAVRIDWDVSLDSTVLRAGLGLCPPGPC